MNGPSLLFNLICFHSLFLDMGVGLCVPSVEGNELSSFTLHSIYSPYNEQISSLVLACISTKYILLLGLYMYHFIKEVIQQWTNQSLVLHECNMNVTTRHLCRFVFPKSVCHLCDFFLFLFLIFLFCLSICLSFFFLLL